ncbi:hypothetical protein [Vibrio proteolyticus]|uniref:Uncharacterized protein n=1 Tax=Vibrio proteolyticus NBRC 13287 TaxID=1219065 RepID=U3A788_VIBPR|nr:hypothetical protein [Vibrio proteolyticus]GAD69570.1 hypothetical protein VPR01S_40_00030 [Vibrio proteolyticus NBRC 13287]
MKFKTILAALVALSFLIPSTAMLINDYVQVSFIKNNIELLETIQKYEFAILVGLLGIAWIISFHNYRKYSDFKLHDLAGILGVFLSALSLSAITFYQEQIFVLSFALSGALCAYCTSVPMFHWFKDRLNESKFEVTFLSFVFGAVFLYVLDGYSGIMINQVFGVNEGYFSFTKPVSMLLLLSPWLALGTFLAIIYITVSQKGSTGVDTFYSINKLSACYVVLILSMAFGSRMGTTLELVAGKFDFDSISPCQVNESVTGVIVLDPAHTKVLVKSEAENVNKYSVIDCILKIQVPTE